MTVIIFRSARVFDGHAPDYAQSDVVIADGLVQSVERHASLRLDYLENDIKSMIGVTAGTLLHAPSQLERSAGKARRVVDHHN